MHFQIQKIDLMNAISIVSKALSSRTTHPMLEGVLMVCKDNTLWLTCSDGSIQIETQVAVDTIREGELILLGRLFFEIIRKCPDELIIIEQPDETQPNVLIRCGQVKINLQGFSADEFPKIQPIQSTYSLELPQSMLKDMIKQTVFACATDESRPALTGVLFEAKGDILTLVALDGYRLAMRRAKAVFTEDFSVIVPASSLQEIMKTLRDDEETVQISFSSSSVELNVDHTSIHSLLINGDFMKYEQIFPKEYNTNVQVNRIQLLHAIERASLMARENKNNLVRFLLDPNKVTICANSEIGSAEEELEAHLQGTSLEIAFNARYMQDVLSRLEDEEILLRFQSNITPCAVEPLQGSAYYYLVLPVRLMNR